MSDLKPPHAKSPAQTPEKEEAKGVTTPPLPPLLSTPAQPAPSEKTIILLPPRRRPPRHRRSRTHSSGHWGVLSHGRATRPTSQKGWNDEDPGPQRAHAVRHFVSNDRLAPSQCIRVIMGKINVPTRITKNLLYNQNRKHLRELKGIASQPNFERDEQLIDQPGYNPDTQLYGAFEPAEFQLGEATLGAAQQALGGCRQVNWVQSKDPFPAQYQATAAIQAASASARKRRSVDLLIR